VEGILCNGKGMEGHNLRILLEVIVVQVLDDVCPSLLEPGDQLRTWIDECNMTSPAWPGVDDIRSPIPLLSDHPGIIPDILCGRIMDILHRRP